MFLCDVSAGERALEVSLGLVKRASVIVTNAVAIASFSRDIGMVKCHACGVWE